MALRRVIVVTCALALLAAGAALAGPEAPEPPSPPGPPPGPDAAPDAGQDAVPHARAGSPLSSAELSAIHSGAELAGCYIGRGDEDPAWAERMAADGALYDLEQGGQLVGSWWVDEGGVICFAYTDREPGPYCFTGRRRGRYVDYYSTVDGALSTSTDPRYCGDAPVA